MCNDYQEYKTPKIDNLSSIKTMLICLVTVAFIFAVVYFQTM